MTSNSDAATRRTALLGLAGAVLAFSNPVLAQTAAHAALGKALDFDASTWARLLRQGPRPAAYVFTTTYCSTCPDVFEQLHAAIVASRQRVELAAVVMDAQGAQVEMAEIDEDVFRAAEELGIDISRPERGSDEEDARRAMERGL